MTEHSEGHIVRRYDGELAYLRGKVLEMGGLVLFQLDQFVNLLNNSCEKLAKQIIERDSKINSLDVETHREVLKLLAKRAPLAIDLRTIISAAKIVTELEHIGDELVKVSYLFIDMQNSKRPQSNKNMLHDAISMGKMARAMLRGAIDSFDTVNLQISVHVARESRELENEFQAILQRLTSHRLEFDDDVGHRLSMVLIIKAMERIGDHTKNIVEHVVYMAKGKDVRHIELDKLFEEVYISN